MADVRDMSSRHARHVFKMSCLVSLSSPPKTFLEKTYATKRNWDTEKDGLPDYSNLEKFMRFLDKYAKHNINGNMLKKWKGQNRNKTLIHKLKPGDLANVTLIYEAKLGVWAEGMLGLGADERTA